MAGAGLATHDYSHLDAEYEAHRAMQGSDSDDESNSEGKDESIDCSSVEIILQSSICPSPRLTLRVVVMIATHSGTGATRAGARAEKEGDYDYSTTHCMVEYCNRSGEVAFR